MSAPTEAAAVLAMLDEWCQRHPYDGPVYNENGGRTSANVVAEAFHAFRDRVRDALLLGDGS